MLTATPDLVAAVLNRMMVGWYNRTWIAAPLVGDIDHALPAVLRKELRLVAAIFPE